jgi:hypothetical protein
MTGPSISSQHRRRPVVPPEIALAGVFAVKTATKALAPYPTSGITSAENRSISSS